MKKLSPYLPEFLGVFLALLVINVWYLSSVAISEEVLPKSYDYAVRAFTVAIGAFIGALSAFKFNEKLELKKQAKEQEKNRRNEALAVQKVLVSLARQLNALCNLQNSLSQYAGLYERAFSMPAQKNFHHEIYVNVDEIAFLVDKDPQLLFELSVEQDGFLQTVESLHVRNAFYVEKVQPEMERAGLNNRLVSAQEIELKLPYPIFKGALDGSKALSENLEETLDKLEKARKQLLWLAKKTYPDHKFFDVEKA